MTQALSPGIDLILPGNTAELGIISRTGAAALVGGLSSVLGGGKFQDGAVTGAFSRLFNDEGENVRNLVARKEKPVWPTDYEGITSPYSLSRTDPLTGEIARPHTAVDIKNPHGAPVYSILEGEITAINSSSSAGNYIKISHSGGLETSYSHTGSAVSVGDRVLRGQGIGYSDSSGRIRGPHLHFVTRQNGVRVNPCTVLSCP